jgi:threonine/homoserine/homoserine lactone efflux protein
VLVLSQVPAWLVRFLYIAGGLFILYLAYGIYKSWKNFDSHIPSVESDTRQSILKAVVMNFLSPGPYIFWTLVTGPILLKGWLETPFNGVGFLAGFYSTLVSCLAAIILIFGTATKLGPKFNRMLLGISSIALLCFGLYQLWLGIFNG